MHIGHQKFPTYHPGNLYWTKGMCMDLKRFIGKFLKTV